jgi:hypothetical protein
MMLGFGAVEGGDEDPEVVCACEGGSCRMCREVEKGRIDDMGLAPQPFRRAGKCDMGRVEMFGDECRCEMILHRACCCFMACRQRWVKGAASIF